MNNPDNTPPLAWLSRKKLLLMVLGLVLFFFGVLIFNLIPSKGSPSSTANQCLTTADYAALTGQLPEGEFSPAENFYTYTTRFKDGENYAEPSAVEDTLRSFGDFFKSHPTKSMIFNLASDYEDENGEILATGRIDKVIADLRSYGVNENTIFASTPELIDDEEGASTSFVTISMTSVGTCK